MIGNQGGRFDLALLNLDIIDLGYTYGLTLGHEILGITIHGTKRSYGSSRCVSLIRVKIGVSEPPLRLCLAS